MGVVHLAPSEWHGDRSRLGVIFTLAYGLCGQRGRLVSLNRRRFVRVAISFDLVTCKRCRDRQPKINQLRGSDD